MREFLVQICKNAGNILKEHFGKDLERIEKINAGFVTKADLESEEYLTSEILKTFPGSSILSEEMGKKTEDGKYRWIIDPLDGTTNFASGIPFFAISIAVEEDNELKYAAVHNPILNELFYAEKNRGVFLDEHKVSISNKSDFSKAVFSTGDYYYRGSDFEKSMDIVKDVYQKCRVVRISGSVALALAYTACSKFDGFWQESINYWDIAAGLLMIKEAGGTFSTLNGKTKRPDELDSLITSNQKLHEEFLKQINI